MKKLVLKNRCIFALSLSTLFLFFGCTNTPTPADPGEFKSSYRGPDAQEMQRAGSALPCEKTEVFSLSGQEKNYNQIVENEFREGFIEIGSSKFLSKGISNAQAQIAAFAKEIGACKAYWTVTPQINPQTQSRLNEDYYDVRFFAKVNKNSIFGLHPARPSKELMKKMNRYYGVEVRAIMPDTKAQKANIKEGDVLLFINGSRCTYDNYLQSGCEVKSPWRVLRVYRGGEVMEIK